jgi:YggT family protein
LPHSGEGLNVPVGFLSNFVWLLCQILAMAIFLRALLSWIPSMKPDNPLLRFLMDITEPILAPLRKVIPTVGMMDLSPLIAMIVLSQAGGILSSSLRSAGL